MRTDAEIGNVQLARKATKAVFWNYASFGLGKFLTFLTTAILARLLTQADFGIVALATLATEFLGVVKDLGLGDALIQNREKPEEAANTVFTLNLLLGIILALISYLVAPLVAAYFRQPLVTPLLRVLSLSFALNPLGNVHTVLLRRELAFNKKLIPDTVHAIIKGLVSIGLALAGSGAWALVIGQIAGVVTGVVVSWIVLPWRPRLQLTSNLANKLMQFGFSLLILDAFSVFEANLDYIIIGRRFGEAVLGVYTLAYRLPEVLVFSLLWVIAKAIFPAYASVQDQPDLLRKGFLVTLRYLTVFAMPICVGLALAADPIIRVVFGSNWLEAIPMLRVLAIYALMTAIGFNVGDVYKAVGRADILVKLTLIYTATLIPALVLGAIYYGPLGVAFGHLVVSIINMIIRLAIATRFVKVSVIDIPMQLKPSFISGLVLALVTILMLILTRDLAPLVRLIIMVAAGAVSYLTVLWLVEGQALLEAAGMLGVPVFNKFKQEAIHE